MSMEGGSDGRRVVGVQTSQPPTEERRGQLSAPSLRSRWSFRHVCICVCVCVCVLFSCFFIKLSSSSSSSSSTTQSSSSSYSSWIRQHHCHHSPHHHPRRHDHHRRYNSPPSPPTPPLLSILLITFLLLSSSMICTVLIFSTVRIIEFANIYSWVLLLPERTNCGIHHASESFSHHQWV